MRTMLAVGIMFAVLGCGGSTVSAPDSLELKGEEQALASDGFSAQALCGSGLYCGWSPANGAAGCQQYVGGPTIYCCPSGFGLVNGSCVAPCGTGLSCGWGYISGSNACVQNPANTTAIYCCPAGKTYVSGGCV